MKPKPQPKPKAASAAAPVEKRPSAFESRLEALGRSPLAYLAVSALLLVPCFWHSRIHAGDLSSHIYNTWLAQLIEAGKTTGLAIVPQFTNVVFDWMLAALFGPLGANGAQRVAVSVCVLVFAWGAFYCISRMSGRRAWAMMPIVAILTYGWTFHMGFFNMYLSLGICVWAIGAAWDGSRRGIGIAAALLAVAFVAHGLPVAWTVAIGAYAWAARRWGRRALPTLMAVSVAAIVLLRILMESVTITRWDWHQVLSATGGFQALVFGEKYLAIMVVLIAVWAAMFYSVGRREGWDALVHDLPFHFAVLTAAGIAILPSGAAIAGYRHGLTFVAHRMSLPLGVCFCAVAARSDLRRLASYAGLAAAAMYFAFLYADTGVLDRFEDKVAAVVAPLKGQRVVSGISAAGVEVDAIAHMVDRACVGVCYSYANYEASTWQFRIRAIEPNPFVAADYSMSYDLQAGKHIVQPSELPLYRIDINESGDPVVTSLKAGEPNGIAPWSYLE